MKYNLQYLKNIKFNNTENIIIWLFSVTYIFVSQDPNLEDQSGLTLLIKKVFMSQILPNFTIFDGIVLLLGGHIIIKYEHSFLDKRFRKERNFFLLTVLFIIFSLINPNNSTLNPIFGLPLLSDNALYVYLLFIYSLFFITHTHRLFILLNKIVKTLLIVSIFRVILLLLLWAAGKGVNYFGVMSTTMEEDTLLLSVLFSVLFLIKYYQSRNKKYVIMWLLYLIFQILSFRRSGMLLMLLVSGTFYFLARRNKYFNFKKYVKIFISVLILYSLTLFQSELPTSFSKYLNRYVGQFIELPQSYRYDNISQNLHIEQSNESMLNNASKLPFWGFGYGKTQKRERTNFQGNTGIHNAYFNLWEEKGLFALIYYLIIILYMLREAFITIINRNKWSREYWNLRIGILIFLGFFFVNSYVLMMVNLVGLKMRVMMVLVFAFLFRINQDIYNIYTKENGKFNP